MSNNRTVFLVDDDPMHTQMLKDHLLSKLKINITTFSTGEDCLNNMDKNPHIVILDYHLNSVNKDAQNGIDILKRLKAGHPETTVVMLSGQDRIEVAIETMKYGAFDYVVKNESAFVRTENVMNNIYKSIRDKELLKAYKTATWVLGGVILFLIVLAIILKVLGISTDNIGWV